MDHGSNDNGVISAIIERLEEQRLPRALDLKDKVDQGSLLDDMDIEFLERVLADNNNLKPLLARHPEYQDLAARMIGLYLEITTKALKNEQQRSHD